MKKILSLLLVTVIFITLTAPIVYASKFIIHPTIDPNALINIIPTPTPKIKVPVIPPTIDPGTIKDLLPTPTPKTKYPPKMPRVPKDVLDDILNPPEIPEDKTPKVPVNPGKPKTKVPKSGKFVTSEGPLFIMFRDDLTKGYEMFTPMDLSFDGEYVFLLVSNAMHTVGELIVTIRQGMVTVSPQMYPGVKIKDGILTFFEDISSVSTIKPSKLKKVDIPFDMPVNVMSRLGVDNYVLMYINCPVSYKRNSEYITPFSLEDEYYLERMYELIDLMD
ncbi:MAG: hypothetical protein ACOX54_09400 [Christensenellales bacterium]|jgi:hypothetical protein